MAGSHGGSRRWRRLRSGEENRGGGECSGERMRTRESEEERQGGAWRLRASRRKQEVAEASRARATPRLCPSGEGGRRQGRGGDGLGRLGRLVAPGRLRVSGPGRFPLSPVLLFCLFYFYLIFCHCFEFKIIQTMPKAPLNIFILLYGLFQKLIKYFRGI